MDLRQGRFGSRTLPNYCLKRRQAMIFQKHETFEVITGCLRLQHERGGHDAQTAHQFAAHLGQGAKRMLDTGARCGDRAVASFLRLGNAFRRMAASLNMHAPAGLLQAGFAFNARVSPVGTDIPARVAQVEQLFEDSGVSHGSMGDGDLVDQLATLVDAGVQLVPEVILAVLSGPLGINILSRTLVRFPAQRHRAFLDQLGFLWVVALDRSLHQRGVDDLSSAGQVTL